MSNGMPSPELLKAPETPLEESAEIGSVAADRRAYEQSAEYEDAVLHAETESELDAAKATHVHAVNPPPEPQDVQGAKDEVVIEVERILEEGIGPFYASLPAEAKAVFKKRGEEVASQIAEMVRRMHLRVRKVVKLIADWLRTIPGVNRYFLEQEAKIKADMLKQLMEARRADESRTDRV